MTGNPIDVSIPANSQGSIQCLANAAFWQRVTLDWPGDMVFFQGTGEGEPMQTPDRQNAYLLRAESSAYRIRAMFEYSTGGPNGPFQLGRVLDPVVTDKGMFTIVQVTSEDSADNDNNDSYLTIVHVSDRVPDEPPPETEPSPAVSGTSGQLELHAKTYYDNPYISGGDEHYIIIPPSYDTVWYRGTGWSMLQGQCYNQTTPLGGYLYISVRLGQCTHPDMHDAILTLYTQITYWGSGPTGYRSVDWEGDMQNTQYHLTRVTN